MEDVDEKIRSELGESLLREVDVGLRGRKMVDRIVVSDDVVYVIEIEDELNYIAIGQALVYSELYKQKYLEKREVKPVIVCSKMDLDLMFACEKLGIKVINL
ncbi:MAG: hypothetical protein QXP99_05595 [Thermoproteota archaeon]